MNRLVVTTEQHFTRTPAGVFVHGNEDYAFFRRYLEVFDEVCVLSRVGDAASVPEEHQRADGPGVVFLPLPDFRGLASAPRVGLALLQRIAAATASRQTAYLLRVPGPISTLTWALLKLRGRPYGLEVVTDPAEAFQRQAFGSATVGALRTGFVRLLRKQCREAACTAYVTEATLQQRYPPGNAHTFGYSSIDIGDEVFRFAPGVAARLAAQPEAPRPFRLVFVGRLWRPFKGLDVLLSAVQQLAGRGHDVLLEVIGGGEMVDTYRQQAEALGIGPRVAFRGELSPASAIYERLAAADLFVLPTRREGLPRAVIEAMAVGLPCVATPIGGIPEQLRPEDLTPVDDAGALADKVEEFAVSRARRVEAAAVNSRQAHRYRRSVLHERRRQFYTTLARTVAPADLPPRGAVHPAAGEG